jgi:hypothetical protein
VTIFFGFAISDELSATLANRAHPFLPSDFLAFVVEFTLYHFYFVKFNFIGVLKLERPLIVQNGHIVQQKKINVTHR